MKVNLGCGSNIRDGFLNIDLTKRENKNHLQYDLSKGLPPQVKNATLIYSSHFFEHLTNEQAVNLLSGCYKALAPKGLFRMVLPNFSECFKNYIDNNKDFWNGVKHVPANGLIIEYLEFSTYQNGQHKSLWDFEKCEVYLKQAGFTQVEKSQFNPKIDLKARKRYSFYVNARRHPVAAGNRNPNLLPPFYPLSNCHLP